MHPSKEELRNYVDKNLAGNSERSEIAAHISECEFCTEFCGNYESLISEESNEQANVMLPEKLGILERRLFGEALRSRMIHLMPLANNFQAVTTTQLAAHGPANIPEGTICTATLFSENPNVVLRLMRDQSKKHEYLHVIADDNTLSEHVLVQIPELNIEYVTDENGIADIDSRELALESSTKWQLKMPDAIFELKPMKYDPDSPEYSKATELSTERGDKIRVRFESRTDSKVITVEVLELADHRDFSNIRIGVQSGSGSTLGAAEIKGPISFGSVDINSIIHIRLYQ